MKEYEKKYGRVDLGPKWGLNQITGKPRKMNEGDLIVENLRVVRWNW